MQILKDKIYSNKAPTHFLAYSLSFMAYGFVITGLGPLVPYLAAETGHSQTQYAYLFFCRSIGFLVGAVVLRLMQKKFTFHTILLISSIVLFFLQLLFCYVLNLIEQGIVMFFISAFCCLLEVTINVSVLETQKNGDIQFWMLVCHGIFGVGGLIGPILVYFFQLYSFGVMGLMIILVSPFYYVLITPQDHKKIQQAVSKEGFIQQIKNAGHQGPYPAIEHKPQKKKINKEIQMLISFMFLIYIALECSYGSWIASYAVLQSVSTKQQATKYSAIFWISITIFRFISTCVNIKSMKKLFLLGYLFIFSSILTILFLMLGLKSFACVFSAIVFGMCFSSMFPLLLAVPSQYNLEITAGQGANFMVWAALGQGFLSTLAGYLMDWFQNDMLFYTIFIYGAMFLISTHILKKLFEKQVSSETSNPQLEMKQVLMKEK